MKYAVETGPGVMIYIPTFMKTVSGILKLRGVHIHTDSMGIA
jgi:hypothetical protein